MERRKGKVSEVSEGELQRRLRDSDRRGELRSDVALAVELPLDDWDEVRRVYTSNISKGGLLFTLTPPASVPASVDLTLMLPDGRKVTLTSQVRHVARREGGSDFEVGVQFADLDAVAQRAFEDALAKLAAD
jgi:hypothetical protein